MIYFGNGHFNHTLYKSRIVCMQYKFCSDCVNYGDFTDIPAPVGVRAEVTADNTSIRVSWEWSRQGVLMCIDVVRVLYQPEGGSQMMYTVSNTTATSATLPNLQCNTKYTIWVHARGSQINRTSTPRIVSLPARGMYMLQCIFIEFIVVCNATSLQPHPLSLMSLLSPRMLQVSG